MAKKKVSKIDLMDAAIDQLGIGLEDQANRTKAAQKIHKAVAQFELHQANKLSDIIRDDRDRLDQFQRGLNLILGCLRNADPGFVSYFMESGEKGPITSADRDRLVQMFGEWDQRVDIARKYKTPSTTMKKGGRPREIAPRMFVAALHDIFDEHRPNDASGTPSGPLMSFVEIAFEIAGEQRKDLSKLVGEVRRHLKGDPA